MIAALALLAVGLSAEAQSPPAPEPSLALIHQPHVLLVYGTTVLIQGGTDVGFSVGATVLIAPREASEATSSGRGVVIELTSVDADRSYGELSRGDLVKPWDSVRSVSGEPTGSLVNPQRLPFQWRIETALEPILDLQRSPIQDVGLLARTTVAYYVSGLPLRAEVGLSPLGVVIGGPSSNNPNPIELFGDLGLAFKDLELAIGAGAAFVRPNAFFEDPEQCLGCTGSFSSSLSGAPLFVAALRFGALDGLNLSSRVSVSFNAGTNLNQLLLELDVPLARQVTAVLEGEGGSWGGTFTGALRIAFAGVGGPGTVFFSLGGGLAGLDVVDTSAAFGPALVARLELRL